MLIYSIAVFPQKGKDGARTISSLNTVINDYTTLTANAITGATSIQVSNATLSSSFAGPLGSGDLIFIIQVQGATIDVNDNPSYGNIISYQNCGNHEFAEVSSVSGSNTINLSCPLQKNYTTTGKVQVIRVPRLTTLTVNSGASVTCIAWNGATGGVVVAEVDGNTDVIAGGSIDASSKGFRGGALLDNNATYGVLNFVSTNDSWGAEKGEGIAGSAIDYDLLAGRYCKGAPANGGGGANSHNAGGGGGANAGNIGNWTGFGNPDISNASWIAAWNLEFAGFATATSSGGGRGGYAFSDNNQNALVVGPTNSAWGGDGRRESGGRGGRPLDYSTGKIFMGGGGGAGDQNNSKGGPGGNGGGIIYILSYSTINGGGQIVSNGANGFNTLTSNGTDGAGGAGAGGTIILNTIGATNGVTINANGGNGGNQTVAIFTAETEGPGAGGGGGYIAISNGAVTRTATGGNNGITNSFSLNEFPPNGATKGGDGINNATITNFHITPTTINLCGSSSTTLTVSTLGTVPPGTVYTWFDQPSGGTVLATGPSFTTPVLITSTTYYVASCPGTSRTPVQVNVSASLSPSFTATTVCAGSPTVFTGIGSATITSWSWNFGNGSGTSTQQSPSYTYTTGGTYTVTLTVSDGNCTSTASQSVVVNNAPVAAFSSNAPATGCGPLTVIFSNTSTGANGYSWNFGDGTATSTQTNPTHVYANAGSYNVILTANGSGCSHTLSQTVSVGPAPTASFNSAISACQGDNIQFTNNSIANGSAITGYSWNFGDGSPASSVTNPSHVYTSPGNYLVTLTASNAQCSDDTTISINISAGAVANFSSSNPIGCNPLNVTFANSSTGTTNFSWNFGDGSPISSLANPAHIYTSSGNYTVTLIAILGSCSDTMVSTNLVQISNQPHSSFTAPASVCLADAVTFTNSSTGNGSPITSYNWDFGDGTPISSLQNPTHTFSLPGSYQVRLTVSTGACTDDSIVTVNVNPGPVAGFTTPISTGCGNLVAAFTNTTTGSSNYTWNFGDGSPVSNAISPTHNYTSPGTYTVTLIATQGSCSDTLQQANAIQVNATPLSSFSTSNVCEGDSVHFINTSNGNGSSITSYSWLFGDGNSSAAQSPSHLYANTGTYSVKLTVNSGICSDDTTIAVVVSALPSVGFSSSVSQACDSATVQFSNTSTGANSYNWSFGDGGTSIGLAPAHQYTSPGSYTVVLTAISGGGCSTSRAVLNMIDIQQTPIAAFSASANNVCKDDCISFTDNSSGNATSWVWTFDGAFPQSTATRHPGSVCYLAEGNYTVTLVASNGNCQSTHSEPAYIHVINCSILPRANFILSDTVFCGGTCIDFVDLSTNANSWQWLFPGATPASSTLEHPTNICYGNQGTFSVTLIAGNLTGYDTITFSNLVQVTASPATPIITQVGDTLHASASSGQYQWYFNGISISGATNPQYLPLLTGLYSVSVTDGNGCSASSSQMHVVTPGIEEESDDILFYIYPNPFTDEVFILLNIKKPQKLTIRIYDALGRILLYDTKQMNSLEATFRYDFQEFVPGMYFIEIRSEDRKWVRILFHK